ncbi:hypothetical protein [Ornithinimicrobium kibberense]|uniref:hypothetical protein n=1 Tax=Ornithinimicrobium kibberense TaxID=282060 RepID=UPI00360AA151
MVRAPAGRPEMSSSKSSSRSAAAPSTRRTRTVTESWRGGPVSRGSCSATVRRSASTEGTSRRAGSGASGITGPGSRSRSCHCAHPRGWWLLDRYW